MKPVGFYNIVYNREDVRFRYYCAYCRKMNMIQSQGKKLDLKDLIKIKRIMPGIKFITLVDGKASYGQPSEVIEGGVVVDLPQETTCYCHHCKIKANAKRDKSIGTTDVPRCFFKYIHVQEDYKRVYLNVFGYYNTYFNERLQINEYMTRYVFNFRIGGVTMLQPLDKKGKVPKLFRAESKPKANVTYGIMPKYFNSYENSREAAAMFKKHAFSALTKKLQDEFYFIKDDHFEKIFTPVNTVPLNNASEHRLSHIQFNERSYFRSFRNIMNDTIHAFRFHSLPPYFLRGISTMALYNRNGSEDDERYKKIMSAPGYRSTKQMSDIYKAAKVEFPKSVRKAITSIDDIFAAEKAKKVISRTENLAKAINLRNIIHEIDRDNLSMYFKLFETHYAMQLMNENKKLSKEKAKIKAETLVIKHLSREKGFRNFLLRDTIRNLIRLKKEGVPYTIVTDHTIKRIHDDTSSLIDKIRRPNKNIYHDEQFLHLEGQYGEFTFRFPRNTHDLIDIGMNMNICVGGYDIRAFRKDVNILQVTTKDSPYVCCIELSADYKNVYQTKTPHNQYPEGELRKAILKWIEDHELLIATHDICRGSGKPNDLDTYDRNAPYPLPLPQEVINYQRTQHDNYIPYVTVGHDEMQNVDFEELLAV